MGDVRFSHGRGDNGLFQESAEHEAAATRGAPVEPKGELLQVGLEVVGGDRAPVRAWVVATGHRGDLRYRHLARGTHRYILGQEELTDHPPSSN